MKFLSVRYRIALGLVSILLSTMFLLIVSGFGPDPRLATLRGRKILCESLGINSSLYISRGELTRMRKLLDAIVQRDDDLLSAAVRRADGQAMVQIGDHDQRWSTDKNASTERQVQVPLWSGDKRWGAVELCFRPVTAPGWRGLLANPWTIFTLAVGGMTLVSYSIYLRLVLRQLDPSRAIPKRVRSALDALAEGLLVTDKRGRVLLANEAFAKWAGMPADKLIGRAATNFPWQPTVDQAPLEFPWARALKEQMPQPQFPMKLVDSKSRHLNLVANASPVLGHDGQYRGVLTSFEDVTQLEQHKVELSHAKQAADDANQAKSDFLARMSHEIRTPMNAILGYTEVLRRGYEDSEQQRTEYLRTIQNSGEHLLALINDILDLSKIEAGRLELELARCSPQEIIAQVASVLRIKAEEKGLTLACEAPEPLPETILTDAVRLRQTLINLVGNAIKFTEKGSVRIVARLDEQQPPRLNIDVVDTGIGMSKESLKRIFDPFSQADTTITRRFGGTGLGLSISRQLAQQLGGEVSVSSVVGQGTVFTVSIDPGPLDDVPRVKFDPRAATTRPREEKSETRLPPARILVVDDGAENRNLVALFLRRAGVEVAAAENGKVAVAMVAQSHYDAVLMDMQMPVMDGFKATTLLREQGCKTPIIALTANVMQDDRRKCHAAGCTGFLTKPIDMDRLLSTLAEVLPGKATAARDAAVGATNETDEKLALQPPTPTPTPPPAQADRRDDLARPASADVDEPHGTATPGGGQATSLIYSTLPTEDPEFREIVAQFIAKLPGRIGEMEEALAQGEMDRLAELAHWLKGAGGSVGYEAFTKPAAALQRSSESSDQVASAAQLKLLRAITERIALAPDESAGDTGVVVAAGPHPAG